MTDFAAIDLFQGNELIENPYPYYEYLRSECPVLRETHHGVVMVTGYDEAVAVYTDTEHLLLVQCGDRPVSGVPGPARGRRRQRPHRRVPRPAAVQ